MLAQMQLSSWDQAILINKVKAFIFSGCSSVKERLNTVQTWPASCRQDDPWQHPWRGEASPDPFSSPLLSSPRRRCGQASRRCECPRQRGEPPCRVGQVATVEQGCRAGCCSCASDRARGGLLLGCMGSQPRVSGTPTRITPWAVHCGGPRLAIFVIIN